MRFAKLVVDNFQGVQHAEVSFGPGLNVLYGPNDLGKSTLAKAIYAALLVPPGSSEALSYSSWYAGATPRASLHLVDDAGNSWCVEKVFAGGASSSATLSFSKDGTSFSLDCKARQVEEKVRQILEWGIPAPGGKGGPRSLPTSFLANVLLAAQTDVDGILGQSLGEDLDTSGKVRLTKALATLAQDPVFKKVLDAAQAEVDQCFTPTWQRKRGRSSRFTEAGNAIKQLETTRGQLEQLVSQSSLIEDRINALRLRHADALAGTSEAADAVRGVKARLEAAGARDGAVKRLEAARSALDAIDAKAARVKALATEIEQHAERERVATSNLALADERVEAAEQALRAAEEGLRRATSDDGTRERELLQAQLERQIAELNGEQQAAGARKAKADAAAASLEEADKATAGAQAARQDVEQLTGELAKSRAAAAEAEEALALAVSLLAYGRWRAAEAATAEAVKVRESAAAARAAASEQDSRAVTLDSRAAAIEEQVSARQRSLPAEEQAAQLGRLERDLEVAEAGLGGGLSVAVKPRRGLSIRAEIDQRPALDEANLAAERLLVAERTVRLSIGELVDIEIAAGAAEQRRVVEALRGRWKTDAEPVLARAGAASVKELSTALSQVAKERAAAGELRREAERHRAEANGLRRNADLQEEQAARLLTGNEDVAARRAAVGARDMGPLEAQFLKLGKSWESQADALQATRTEALAARRAALAAAEQSMKLAEYRASEAAKRSEVLAVAAATASEEIGSGDPAGLARALDAELKVLAARAAEVGTQVKALDAQANQAVQEATAALELAKRGVPESKEARSSAAAAVEGARTMLNARSVEREVLAGQLAAMDHAGAEALANTCQAEVASFPPSLAVSAADLATAEARHAAAALELERAKEDLHKEEGALSKVGGAAVREELQRIDEALVGARAREKELEVDADAWRLLFETLRAVENEEGAHLGRALAGPVTTKFGELTAGRYGDVRLDAALRTEEVRVTGTEQAEDALAALSVGTRDQLATLVRLTIASQLRSAIILDDHLVHADPFRLAWFRDVLTKTAVNTQVIVLTCRPQDYLAKDELPAGAATRDLAGGMLRAIDGVGLVKGWDAASRRSG
ncbi:MAG TPA: AAA family ATPase [Myxococcaceae bacterium]|nr:AAA family ATPase [Myxococcaceae bacterium]